MHRFPRNREETQMKNFVSSRRDFLHATGAVATSIILPRQAMAAHRVDPKTGKLRYQRGSVVNVPSPICILFAK